MQKVSTTSEDIQMDNLEKLRGIFPQFVKEGEIDFDALKAFFENEGVLAGQEKYGLSWAGKSDAFGAIRVPATGTLTPQKDKSKDWDSTQNLFIEGDNLEVLKLLQKYYRGQVKMIYIDPPYNTGKDFIYKDNFIASRSDYYERSGQSNGGIKLTTNAESNGRYHSDWLTMMYPRLFLARNLLRDDGVIFISIDDNEVANLCLIMDEIFGEENFIAQFIHKNNSSKNQAKLVSISTEYIICYARTLENLQKVEWRVEKRGAEDIAKLFLQLKERGLSLEDIEKEIKGMYQRPKYAHLSRWNKIDEKGVFKDADLSREGGPKDYTIKNPLTGKDCVIPDRGWGKSYEELLRLQEEDLIWYGDENTPPGLKDYITSDDVAVPDSFWYFDNSIDTRWIKEEFGNLIFENPKPLQMLKQITKMASREGDIILDFFAGSATTAHAVMAQNAEDGGNRKWICVQLPEAINEQSEAHKTGYRTITDIARERIRRAGDKIGRGDIGFKSFELTKSNYRQWNILTQEDDEETLKNQMKLFIEKPLVDKYTEEGVVYEILVKEGFDINTKVTQETKDDLKLWNITDGDKKLVVTFAQKITREQVDSLGLSENDTFVCLDSALDDNTKVNISRNLTVKVI